MTALIPPRLAQRPRDPDRPQFPVPWFVAWIDGKPDFRCVDARKVPDALRFQKCWLCGQKLGTVKAFVIGPMCAVNRVSAEPPSHQSCAEYAVKVCPFLTQPRMRRNEKDLPEQRKEAAGIPILRNPGVALVWSTQKFSAFRVREGKSEGVLFNIGEPYEISWWAEGRTARRSEILAALETGYPLLLESAKKEGGEAMRELERQFQKALALVPDADFEPQAGAR